MAPLLASAVLLSLAAVPAGRFVLRGTVRVEAPPLVRDERAVEVLALVGPGERPDEVRLHLRSYGESCDLRARLGDRGALTLAPGQTCRVALDDDETRGTVEATLREGAGSVGPRELALSLTWEVAGTIRTRVALGGQEAWLPPVPVRGTARGSARGGPDW